MKIFYALFFFWLSLSASAQAVYVDLCIEKLSPFITRYSKTEMENLMKDSISARLKRGYIERTEKERRITFEPNDDHDYVIELVLSDTVDIHAPEKYRLVRLLTIRSRVYEKGLRGTLMPELRWFGVGSSDYNGKLWKDRMEVDIIKNYCSWTGVVLTTDCLRQIPYLKSHTLTEFNVSREKVKDFNSFSEVVVTKTNFYGSRKLTRIDRLLTDVLLRQQEFYYGIRHKREGYVNIYDSVTDTFTNNTLQLELVLLRKKKGYRMQLVIDKGKVLTQGFNFQVPSEIEFTDEQLERAQTQVLNKIDDMLQKLFRLNLE